MQQIANSPLARVREAEANHHGGEETNNIVAVEIPINGEEVEMEIEAEAGDRTQ